MERLINDAAKLDDSVKANDMSFANIVNAIHAVQQELYISGISVEEYSRLVSSGLMEQEDAWKLLGTSAKEGGSTLEGSANSIQAAWSNLITALADPNADLTMYIDNFIQSAVSMFENRIPAFERALEGVGKFVEGMAKAISEKLPEIIETDLPKWVDSGVSAIMALIQGVINSVPQIVKVIKDLIPVITKTVTENLPMIVSAGLEIIVSLAEGIIDSLPELLPAIIECIVTIVDTLTKPDMLSKLLGAALDLIITVGDGLIDAIPQLVDATILIIDNLIRFLLEPQNLVKIINAGTRILVSVTRGILNAIPELIAGAAEVVYAFCDTIVNTDWWQVGKNIVDGIGEGLDKAWDNLVKWWENAWNGLIDSAKSWLGIHSPSTVFAKIGGYMAEGLGEGWQDEFADVKDDIEDGLDFNANGISTNISGTNTYKNSSSGVGMGGNNIYFYFNIDKVSGNKEDIEENADLLMQIFTEKMSRMGVVFA